MRILYHQYLVRTYVLVAVLIIGVWSYNGLNKKTLSYCAYIYPGIWSTAGYCRYSTAAALTAVLMSHPPEKKTQQREKVQKHGTV